MSDYTVVNLKQVEDMAPEVRLRAGPAGPLRAAELGSSTRALATSSLSPAIRVPFGHRHADQEEVYLVVAGSARIKSTTRSSSSAPGTRSACRPRRPRDGGRAPTAPRSSPSAPPTATTGRRDGAGLLAAGELARPRARASAARTTSSCVLGEALGITWRTTPSASMTKVARWAPHKRAAVHRLLHPHAVLLADGVVGVGEQREVQPLLVVELLDRPHRVGRDAEHGRAHCS